jgi:hypothetical protein
MNILKVSQRVASYYIDCAIAVHQLIRYNDQNVLPQDILRVLIFFIEDLEIRNGFSAMYLIPHFMKIC